MSLLQKIRTDEKKSKQKNCRAKEIENSKKKIKWYEPVFEFLKRTGIRIRWINNEVWIYSNGKSFEPLRNEIPAVELVAMIFFDRDDLVRDRILDDFRKRRTAVLAMHTGQYRKADATALDRYTLRGAGFSGSRDCEEMATALNTWSEKFDQYQF